MAIKRAEAHAVDTAQDSTLSGAKGDFVSPVPPAHTSSAGPSRIMPGESSAQTSPLYTIADLAKEFDTTARTLRHYEAEGLIQPARKGQTRVYSHTDRVRLSWIMRGKRVGFSLAEIKEMLALYELDDGRETQRSVTLKKCYERLADLSAQRDDLDTVIAELTGFCNTLETMERDPNSGRWVDPKTGRPPTRDHLSTSGSTIPATKFSKS